MEAPCHAKREPSVRPYPASNPVRAYTGESGRVQLSRSDHIQFRADLLKQVTLKVKVAYQTWMSQPANTGRSGAFAHDVKSAVTNARPETSS